jgi:DNA topoisomerase IA
MKRVYIERRSFASQCKPAQICKTTIGTQSGEIQWQARGQMLEFAGYAKYWLISVKKGTNQLGRITISHLGKRGFLSKQDSMCFISNLFREMPFS